MKDTIKLLFGVLIASASFGTYLEARESIGTIDEATRNKQDMVKSRLKLVQLENVETVEGLKAAQEAYLNEHYKGYEFHGGYLYGVFHGLYIQGITVRNRKGAVKRVFFDLTDIYRKLENSSDETTREKVRELMEKHDSGRD